MKRNNNRKKEVRKWFSTVEWSIAPEKILKKKERQYEQ